jgi:hypothetical protein
MTMVRCTADTHYGTIVRTLHPKNVRRLINMSVSQGTGNNRMQRNRRSSWF